MEPHPIPQNVTSFQFHLVGDMTLKQFLYLAGGSAIAYIIFVFLAPSYPIVAWPAILVSALSGVALAFLPIASRPLDLWLLAFLKAIYSPTRRIWRKSDATYKENSLFGSRLLTFLSAFPVPVLPPRPIPIRSATVSVPKNITGSPASVPGPFPPSPVPAKPASQPDLPTKEELEKTVELARKAQNLQVKIIQNQRALDQIKSQTQKPLPFSPDYTMQVNKIVTDLQELTKQAGEIKSELDFVTKPEQPVAIPAVPPSSLKEKIKIVIPSKPKQTQLALTSFPNVINGVVKDNGNNLLEGVVTVIYNKEGLPVRALKTNKLGQFSGSTPLPNGTYTLEIEKDNFSFDVLQIELNGEVLPPLMITAK